MYIQECLSEKKLYHSGKHIDKTAQLIYIENF